MESMLIILFFLDSGIALFQNIMFTGSLRLSRWEPVREYPFHNLFIILEKLSSEYQMYACGSFFSYALILEKNAILGEPPNERGVQVSAKCTGDDNRKVGIS